MRLAGYWLVGLIALYMLLVCVWHDLKGTPDFLASIRKNRDLLVEYRMSHAWVQVVGRKGVFLMPDSGTRIMDTKSDWDTLFDTGKESEYTH